MTEQGYPAGSAGRAGRLLGQDLDALAVRIEDEVESHLLVLILDTVHPLVEGVSGLEVIHDEGDGAEIGRASCRERV